MGWPDLDINVVVYEKLCGLDTPQLCRPVQSSAVQRVPRVDVKLKRALHAPLDKGYTDRHTHTRKHAASSITKKRQGHCYSGCVFTYVHSAQRTVQLGTSGQRPTYSYHSLLQPGKYRKEACSNPWPQQSSRLQSNTTRDTPVA